VMLVMMCRVVHRASSILSRGIPRTTSFGAKTDVPVRRPSSLRHLT
jgi:hypothetical protein